MSLGRLLFVAAGGVASFGVAVLVLGAALIVGFDLGASPYVLMVGVLCLGGAAWVVLRLEPDTVAWRLGAIVAAIVGAVSIVVGGISEAGVLQWALLGSGLTATAMGVPSTSASVRGRSVWALMGLALVGLVMVRAVVEGGALGHDESALALKARAWVEGTPDTGWSIHRGIGTSLIAVPVVAVAGSAVALRVVAVVLSLGTLVAVWWLGKTMRSGTVGVAAAAVFAVAPSFLRRGSEFLTDVPSTGLLVAATALLWRWLVAPSPRDAWLMAASVTGAVAVYVRYQSVLSLGLVGMVAAVLFWHRVRRAMGTVLAAAGVGVGLLLPHFVWATIETGTPWGVFVATGEAGRRAFLGEGLVDYLREFPYLVAGPLGAAAILVAVVWAVASVRSRSAVRTSRKPAVFLVLPALLQVLVLGTLSHGEPRFLFFPVALLVVAAAVALDDVKPMLPTDLWRAGVVALCAALVVGVGEAGARIDRNAEARGEGFEVIVEGAEAAAAEAERCAIMTGYLPQVTWETGCASYGYDIDEVAVPDDVAAGGAMLLFEEGIRQPTGRLAEEYTAGADREVRVEDPAGSVGDATVHLFDG